MRSCITTNSAQGPLISKVSHKVPIQMAAPRHAHRNVQRRTIMNWNIVDENWRQFKRRLKALWGKLIGVNGNPNAAVRY
jgi:hypothetical protein